MIRNRFFQLLAAFALATAGGHVAFAADSDTAVLTATAEVEAFASITGQTNLDCGTINYNNTLCDALYTPASVTFDVQGEWNLTLADDAETSDCADAAGGVTVSHVDGDSFCILLQIDNPSDAEGGLGLSSQISATGFEGLAATDDTGTYNGSFTVTLSAE